MQSSEQVNYIAQITPQKKRQENYLKENVKETIWTERSCVFWWDRHCRVAHRENRVVRKFAHARIAILASSYSDDVVAIEVKK